MRRLCAGGLVLLLASSGFSQNANDPYQEGLGHLNRGDLRTALANFQQASQSNPDANTLFAKGYVLSKLGQHEQALDSYNQAAAAAPTNANVYINRGNTQARLGNYDAAIADQTRAAQLQPNNHLPYFNRGFARAKTQDHQGAVADFNRSLELNPSHAGSYHYRGQSHAALGDDARAQADGSRARAMGYQPRNDSSNLRLNRAPSTKQGAPRAGERREESPAFPKGNEPDRKMAPTAPKAQGEAPKSSPKASGKSGGLFDFGFGGGDNKSAEPKARGGAEPKGKSGGRREESKGAEKSKGAPKKSSGGLFD
ncbi:lipoprotein NlpI [Planctomycetes bacterium Pan216]|uniref:Lipoprotein NlpI n=1 Tax=Kolteria novifilia TaxID=2527975 RepID=A0A518BBN4_9BACT|nr:lipoprotein NlpI [Planctomycetes bacterium Pan216]